MDLRKILLISLGHLSCDLNGGALPSLMPYLAAAHGFNYQAAGALMFAYSATSSLVQPVFGYLADKHARSWFVPLAVLLAGGSLGLVGFLDSYWAIFLTLMLCGVGGALLAHLLIRIFGNVRSCFRCFNLFRLFGHYHIFVFTVHFSFSSTSFL